MSQLDQKDSSSLLRATRDYLFLPTTTAYGVESLASPRVWQVLCC